MISAKKRESIEKEYRLNSGKLGGFDGYIRSQRQSPFADLTFCGRDIGGHGCELIAVYNALKYLGKPRPFPRIISGFRERSLQWNGGRWGVSPRSVGRYLSAVGVDFTPCPSGGKMRKKMGETPSGCGIVSYWNKPMKYGIHTVFFTYETAADGGLVLTVMNGADREIMFRRAIYGYLL